MGRKQRITTRGFHSQFWWLACAIAASVLAIAIVGARIGRHQAKSVDQAIPSPRLDRDTAFGASLTRDFRPCRLYPYSVIPCGAHSVAELRSAIAHDPVVARHYANFDVSRASIVRLRHNEEMYVSYRLGDRIYWTKKRLMIRAGEALITDGKHEARTRCGNRLSATPVKPVSSKEPKVVGIESAPQFSLLATNSGTPPNLPLGPPPIFAAPMGITSPQRAIPPTDYPMVGAGSAQEPAILAPGPPPVTGPPIDPHPVAGNPPIATPEPSTILLLALGLVPLIVISLLVNRGKGRSSLKHTPEAPPRM